MSSAPISISISTVSNTISSALNSYRRVQCLIAESPFAPSINVPLADPENNIEEEPRHIPHDVNVVAEHVPSHPSDHSFVSQLDWDEEVDSAPRDHDVDRVVPQAKPYAPRSRRTSKPGKSAQRRENTPLLRALSIPSSQGPLSPISQERRQIYHAIVRPECRTPPAPSHSVQPFRGGQSTFGQSLFNTTAILLGIGVLSEPLAFACTGWIAGTVLLILYALTSCYTAKILAGFIFSDSRIRTYADIGRMAFGPLSNIFVSLLFCLELFSVCVLLVTLYGDSLHAIFPQFPANVYKAFGAVILIPTVFLPLSLLSFTSIFGIISSTMLVAVVLIDGLSKQKGPGSLWDPAQTSLGVPSPDKLAIAFGLFMAGFSGHAVIPSLARDMADPSQFNSMVNWAFGIATFIYAAIGFVGYLMFGSDVSDEISKDLLRTAGYNPGLNGAVLWMLVINPISKFALNMHPLYMTVEIILGFGHPADGKVGTKGHDHQSTWGQNFLRILLTISAVAVSMVFPQFSAVMAFMGSFSAFMINLVGPIAAKVAMQGRCGILDGTVMIVGVVMTVWGTYAAFFSA